MTLSRENFICTAQGFDKEIEETLKGIKDQGITERIWEKDYTIWSDSPAEITNRLGWLKSPESSLAALKEINRFVDEIKNESFTDALLLGMGGSSLAPEVFQKIFGHKAGYLNLHVLDSTDPGAVLNYTRGLDPAKTLYIVSTKSGGTIETISFMKYFFNYALGKLGLEEARKHFIAITDPGSGLQQMAEDLKFRKVFLNDPEIGGRYSALSLFGIVPAALIGVDAEAVLNRGAETGSAHKSSGGNDSSSLLGALLGSLAANGIDKVTFILSPNVTPFGAWVEQLVAESTGKSGKGILPVESESIESPVYYSKDRLFVYIKTIGDTTFDSRFSALKSAGFPTVEIIWNDLNDLGSEFMRWELATAVASWKIMITPFDQPNVESAKILARGMIKAYKEEGKLPELDPVGSYGNITVYSNSGAGNIIEALNKAKEFLSRDGLSIRRYVAIQAYLTPEEKTTEALQLLRTKLQKNFKVATTVGYGPRFLHSTGQLHKGDSGNGLFIQFTSGIKEDVPIPEEAGKEGSSITFGVLLKAQALGDFKALAGNNRTVLRFDLDGDVIGGITRLISFI
jgi:glucose-6-phosphate isomerase